MLGRSLGTFAGGMVAPDRPSPQPVGGGQVATQSRAQQPGLLDTAAGAAGAYQGVSGFGDSMKDSGGGDNTSAIQRRMDTQRDSLALADAEAALNNAPPEYQQQYGSAIKNARYLDAQKRGLA